MTDVFPKFHPSHRPPGDGPNLGHPGKQVLSRLLNLPSTEFSSLDLYDFFDPSFILQMIDIK
jgi:hypothetical protein